MKYGDKIIRMEGVIVEVHDGSVAIDFKGRLGHLRIPKRMIISDYDLEIGQEVAWNMSFIRRAPKSTRDILKLSIMPINSRTKCITEPNRRFN